jgi:hypothetical protein
MFHGCTHHGGVLSGFSLWTVVVMLHMSRGTLTPNDPCTCTPHFFLSHPPPPSDSFLQRSRTARPPRPRGSDILQASLTSCARVKVSCLCCICPLRFPPRHSHHRCHTHRCHTNPRAHVPERAMSSYASPAPSLTTGGTAERAVAGRHCSTMCQLSRSFNTISSPHRRPFTHIRAHSHTLPRAAPDGDVTGVIKLLNYTVENEEENGGAWRS